MGGRGGDNNCSNHREKKKEECWKKGSNKCTLHFIHHYHGCCERSERWWRSCVQVKEEQKEDVSIGATNKWCCCTIARCYPGTFCLHTVTRQKVQFILYRTFILFQRPNQRRRHVSSITISNFSTAKMLSSF